MKWANERRILFGVFVFVLGILGVVSFLSYRTTAGLINATAEVQRSHRFIEALGDLLSQVVDAETGQRGYLITGEEAYLAPYRSAVEEIYQRLSDLQALTAGRPKQQQRLTTLRPLIQAKLSELQQTINVRREKGFGPAQQLVLTGKGERLMDDIRSVIAAADNRENDVLKERDATTRADARNTIVMLFLGIVVGAGLLSGVFTLLTREVSQRRRAEAEQQSLARQEAAIASLSQLALSGVDLSQIMDEAAIVVARTLDVEYAKVLELLPGSQVMLLRAGVGWKEGTVGRATVSADKDSQAGYTLLSHEPVVIEDLRAESRFSGPPLLFDHHVVSGMSVIIPGRDRPFGVLGAHTAKRRTFNKDGINFLQAIANSLATVIERRRTEAALRESEKSLAEAQRIAHLGSWDWDLLSNSLTWSDEIYRIFGLTPQSFGATYEAFLGTVHPDDRELVMRSVDEALSGRKPYDIDHRIVLPDGTTRTVHEQAEVSLGDGGKPVRMVGTVQDVTERRRAEEALRQAYEALQAEIAERVLAQQASRAQAEVLVRTLNVLIAEPSLEKFLDEVLIAIAEQFKAHSTALWLYDPATNATRLRQTAYGGRVLRGAEQLDHPNASRPVVGPPTAALAASYEARQPYVFQDAPHNLLFEPEVRSWAAAQGVKSVLSVPLLFGKEAIGIVSVRDAVRDSFTPQEKELAQALAHQATLALMLTRLAEQGQQSAVLAERNRMAREIHDTLAQGFTGIVLQLEAAGDILGEDPEEARAHVGRAQILAREGLGEARRSVWALRPQVLEGGDLPDALRRLVGQLTAGTQAETEFSLQGTPRPLPQEVEVNLLRIAQESLANALKHSKASKVDVELSYGPHDVVLSVQDNGRGFDPRQRSIDSGFGLISLHERAERVGAQLTVYSEPGLGTRIVVVVPGALPHAQGGSM